MSIYAASSPQFVIRSPENSKEQEAFFRLQAQIFRPNEDRETTTISRSRFVINAPEFQPQQLRGVFMEARCVAGYVVFERVMSIGSARLQVGCICSVGTHPDFRNQGIATAMMQDAIQFAREQGYAMLFLHGLRDFYHRFGYTDVMEDFPVHHLSLDLLSDPAPVDYIVRTVTEADIPCVLRLYQQEYGAYIGGFASTRTLARQRHVLYNWVQFDTQSLIAENAMGGVEGYLLYSLKWGKLDIHEFVAETWPAALALLKHYAQLVEKHQGLTKSIQFMMPTDCLTYYQLAANVTLRSEMYATPNGGWMVRAIHWSVLFGSLLPLWQEYWLQRPLALKWNGTIKLSIGTEQQLGIQIQGNTLRFVEKFPSDSREVRLSTEGMMQLVFGFRPVEWVVRQNGQVVDKNIIQVLKALFPQLAAGVAGTDYF